MSECVFWNRKILTLTHELLHRLNDDVVLLKSKGGMCDMFTMCDFHTHSLPLLLSPPLTSELCHQIQWVVSKVVVIWGRGRGMTVFLSVRVCLLFLLSSSMVSLSILGLFALSSFRFVCLFFFNWVAVSSLTCRHSSKKGGEEEQKESIMSQKCSPPMFAVSVSSSSRINRWLHRG